MCFGSTEIRVTKTSRVLFLVGYFEARGSKHCPEGLAALPEICRFGFIPTDRWKLT